jgi:chemotaxis protein MotD
MPGRDAGEHPRQWKLAAHGDRLALRMPDQPDVQALAGEAVAAGIEIALPAATDPQGDPQGGLAAGDAAEPDAAAFPAAPDEDAMEDAAPLPFLAPPPDDAVPAGAGRAGPATGDDEAALRALLRAASGGRVRSASGDGERAPAATPAQGPAAARADLPPQAPAASAGETGREPERPRLAVDTGMPPRSGANADPHAGANARSGDGPGRMPVSVLGFSTSSAPVTPPPVLAGQLSPTAAGVVAAIEAEPAWRAAAAEAAIAQRGQAPGQAPGQTHGVVSSLRIQLNPAELGMVTARLVASGSQLEIEIRVESNDARQRLANDSDAIVRALRGVGYDVERVTIQQAQPAGATAQQDNAGGRNPLMQQEHQHGRAGGGRNGRDGPDDGGSTRPGAGEAAAQRAGGGVYI